MKDLVKERARKARWRLANAERKRQQDAAYRKRHPGRCLDAQQRWERANPLRSRLSRALREMRQRGVAGSCSLTQLMSRWEYYGGRCHICGVTASEIDHVKPVAFGGANWPCNLRPVCSSCNRRKSSSWQGRHTSKVKEEVTA